ncbi:MAG TPA: DUF4097 family beta strand repeat-containing protein [Thermoanaerobaculia bacterium]|jgi:hypothetical protein
MRRLTTLALALCLATTAFADDDILRRGFNVSEGGTLRLHADLGAIKVVSGGTGVAIEVVRKPRGERGEERMRAHRIEFRQSGNDVIIDDELEGRNNWFSWSGERYDVQWNIRVPARYNVDLRTSGSSIDLADIGGTVDARTSGGGIRTGRIANTATLNTSGGSIKVDGANGTVIAHTSGGSIDIGNTTGAVEARTSGGSIRLGRSGGEVVARTSGGGIRIEEAMGTVDATTSGGSIQASIARQPASDSSFSTSGGSITVTLARGIGAELDARASGGGVSSDVPITVQGTQRSGVLQGRINSGGPKLTVRTSGGSIKIKNS